MNYLIPAIFSYLLNAGSVLTDKFLLSKRIPDPFAYIVSISTLGILAVLFLPFTHIPTLHVFILASLSTLIWTAGAYFMFKALKVGQASRVAPIIGTLNPVFLILYYSLFTHSISIDDRWGTAILILGMCWLILPFLRSKTIHLKRSAKYQEIALEILAGLLFAVSYVFLKQAYDADSFVTVTVWARLILIPLVIMVYLIPSLKKRASSPGGQKINYMSPTGIIFLFGQTAGGLSGILLSYAISLANPAIVNALQGTQYAFLFIISLALSRKFPKIFDESFSKSVLLQKIIGIIFLSCGLFILAYSQNATKNTTLGYTYSPRYAESLGLNPKQTFVDLLHALPMKNIRIPIYWDQLQPDSPDQFNFDDTDFYVSQTEQNHAKLTLAIGYKVPRYPECYQPNWSKNLSKQAFDDALLSEIKTIVNHYKDSPSLDIWQVENEPLFPFGNCPPLLDLGQVQREVALVRMLDPKHPIMLTESGEFGLWLTTAKNSDIIGTTLYRKTLGPTFPDFVTPLPPFFYQFKAMLVHLFYPNRPIYVAELQAEPWANQPIQTTPLSYQTRAFSLQNLTDIVSYTKQAGFDRMYFWGVEWWYYLKVQGHSEYLNAAEEL